MKSTFNDTRFGSSQPVRITIDRYTATDGICISLVTAPPFSEDTPFEEPWLTATLCDPDQQLGDDQVVIKNYSENEGVLKLLVENGILEGVVDVTAAGHPVASLSPEMLEFIRRQENQKDATMFVQHNAADAVQRLIDDFESYLNGSVMPDDDSHQASLDNAVMIQEAFGEMRLLGAAIEEGDPQEIANLWLCIKRKIEIHNHSDDQSESDHPVAGIAPGV